jgi:serine/threonine-protein kinase
VGSRADFRDDYGAPARLDGAARSATQLNSSQAPTHVVGRYALYGTIASGGMATVHFGRLIGPVGFSRTVAIKRLHPQFASDPEFVAMFLDEARLAARIRHPNVIPTLDVVATSGELFLVMDYVPGESLGRLVRAARHRETVLPPSITVAIMVGALQGLHAAHEARNERGEPLGIVHRDVSPQNVLVGSDGQARVLDFGVAKAAGRVQTTREGQLKGKLSYMAPEQLRGSPLDRQTDIYAAAVVLWETLTGDRLFRAENEGAIVSKVLEGEVVPPSRAIRALVDVETQKAIERLDDIVMRGLARDRSDRFATARDMALAFEQALTPATTSEVSNWIEDAASAVLLMRAGQVGEIESSSSALQRVSLSSIPPPQDPTSAAVNPVPALLAQRRAAATRPDFEAPGTELGPDALSTISVSSFASTPPEAPHKGRWGATAAVVGLATVVLFALGALALRRTHPVVATSPPPPVPVASATNTPRPQGSASNSPPAPAVSASAATTAAPSQVPPSSATTSPTTPVSASTKRESGTQKTLPEGHAHRGGTHSPSPAPVAVDCNPPFAYDAAGKKHYKPECL